MGFVSNLPPCGLSGRRWRNGGFPDAEFRACRGLAHLMVFRLVEFLDCPPDHVRHWDVWRHQILTTDVLRQPPPLFAGGSYRFWDFGLEFPFGRPVRVRFTLVKDREDFLLVVPRVSHFVIGRDRTPNFTPFFRHLQAAIRKGLEKQEGTVYLGIRPV
jgi:hypothetical protein